MRVTLRYLQTHHISPDGSTVTQALEAETGGWYLWDLESSQEEASSEQEQCCKLREQNESKEGPT